MGIGCIQLMEHVNGIKVFYMFRDRLLFIPFF